MPFAARSWPRALSGTIRSSTATKRLALVAMIEFLRRNGQNWPTDLDQDEVAETFERLAARELSEQDLAAWVAAKLARP